MLKVVIRPPNPFDPARACPLIVLTAPQIPRAWERLADREHAVLATLDAPRTEGSLHALRTDACRWYAIDAGRVFLAGGEEISPGAGFSATAPGGTPEVWPELLARKKAPAPAGPTALTVRVTNLRSVRGKVLATLYRSERGFGNPAEAIVAAGTPLVEKTGTVALLTFPGLAAGDAAVLLFHDEDDDRKLATGLFGIPKEGYGASNDPKMRMGPPRWRDSRFLLTGASGERSVSVRVKYL